MNEQILNVNFVAEVEKRPLLYNYTLSEYSRKDLKEKAWSEVATECGITGKCVVCCFKQYLLHYQIHE